MKYLILIILSSFFSTILFADTLKCNFTRYGGANRIEIQKEWLPEIQIHELNGSEAFFKTKWFMKGKVTQNNDQKIKWSYEKEVKIKQSANSVPTQKSKFNFIFFKKSKKVAAEVLFRIGWIPLDNVWGTCEYIINSSNNNNSQIVEKVESNLNLNQKKVINQDFKLIRGSSGTDIFYNQETSTLLIKNNSKYYNKMHKKLIDNPNYDIRIGSFWDKERKKPKKYMFQYKKPEKIFANLNGYIREIYVQDPSVSDILSEKEKYLYVSITDYNDGMWVATRTEKSD